MRSNIEQTSKLITIFGIFFRAIKIPSQGTKSMILKSKRPLRPDKMSIETLMKEI